MSYEIKTLIEVAHNKLNLLKMLLELSEKLGSAISSQNLDDIKKILSEKQRIIERVDMLDVNFVPAYNSFKKEKNIDSIFDVVFNNPSSDISRLKGVLIDIKSIMDKIKEKDDKNIEAINIAYKKAETKLVELSNQKSGYIEYMKYYSPESYFVDKKR
jgi:hypothetical protein